jgi:hypothetical protein
MSIYEHDNGHDPASIPLPRLSDEAVIQIQDFIYSVLDLFEDHYFGQIHRYYADRSAHNMIPPVPPPSSGTDPDLDDIPF